MLQNVSSKDKHFPTFRVFKSICSLLVFQQCNEGNYFQSGPAAMQNDVQQLQQQLAGQQLEQPLQAFVSCAGSQPTSPAVVAGQPLNANAVEFRPPQLHQPTHHPTLVNPHGVVVNDTARQV